MDPYQWPTSYNTMPSKHYTQPNAGLTLVHRLRLWPSTIQHWPVLSVGEVQADTDPWSVKCWASALVLDIFPGQWWACVARRLYQQDALNQSSVKVSRPSVTVAHI